MALWHFMKDGKGFSWKDGGTEMSCFDDGLQFIPSEEGFSSDAAVAKAKTFGAGVTAEYTGTPNWGERIEREAKAAAEAEQAARNAEAETARKAQAEAMLDAMLNPVDPKDAEREGINAQFDAMLAELPDRAGDIEGLRKAELDKLEG